MGRINVFPQKPRFPSRKARDMRFYAGSSYALRENSPSLSSMIFGAERNGIPHKFSFAPLARVEKKILREDVQGGVAPC